jgi:phage terminase large subunit-like protein
MTSLLDRYDLPTLHELIDLATDDEAAVLQAALEDELYDWGNWARPEQVAPAGDWFTWLIEAGRGWGKTRTGAEYAKDGNDQSLLRLPNARWAFVPETYADGRDTMIEGESGLLSILPPSALRGGAVSTAWNRSLGELYLDNGSKAKIYASERPGLLRGPQHHGAWGDEPAKWKDAYKGDVEDTTWSNLLLGLRLGADPRCVLTTTPKRVRLLVGTKEKPGLHGQEGVVITKGTTYDNLGNLAPTFRAKILGRYEGTRLGRQELMAELLEDVVGALWTTALIEAWRVAEFPDLSRLVVAVDPAVTAEEDSDDTGIVAIGRDGHGAAYLLEDATCHEAPTEAMTRAVALYRDLSADEIVVEANNGGDYLPSLIHTIDPTVKVRKVHASRGKLTRAEPIHGLHERGLVRFVGAFPDLEEQLTSWVPGEGSSPDRLDAFVWAVTALFPELEAGEGRRLGFRGAA